jgi:hypothetical protein
LAGLLAESDVRISSYSGLGIFALALALGGCDGKETGPDDAASDAAAPLVAPSLPAATADPAAAKPLASFGGKDADGDGKVSSAEYAKAAQTMFQMMDADGDGTVTLAELEAARKAMGADDTVSSERIVESNDADGDGKLTLSEWMAGANARFDGMDLNQDDILERAEWDAANPPGTNPMMGATGK